MREIEILRLVLNGKRIVVEYYGNQLNHINTNI